MVWLRRAPMNWDACTAHLEHRITFSETDGLGFVHHRCATVWFERTREVFFRRYGIPAVELFNRGWYLAVRSMNTRYENFIAYEDVISVRAALTKLGRVAMDFHYRVDNLTTGKLAIRGHTNLVAVERRDATTLALSRIVFDREPFKPLVVDPDHFFGAPQGAWSPPRWDPE